MTIDNMDPKILWLFIFVGLYWAYCLFWGIKGALMSKTATDYMIAGRGLGLWAFALAATATSIFAWTVLGAPDLIYRNGFPYAYLLFYAIVIPFTGVLFLKRQWMLGKRFDFITPGEMLAAYFRSDLLRLLVVLIALVLTIPYLGLQLRASGFLFNALTDNQLSVPAGSWILAAVLVIYVASGGLRAVAYVSALQLILLAAGTVILGLIVLNQTPALGPGLAALAQPDGATTPEGYSSYVAIPGVIQFVPDNPPATGLWTGVMLLTSLFAFMGIQSSPAFSMWAFSSKSPRSFAAQQVWVSSFTIGLILLVFTVLQGVGGHFLGADPTFAQAHPELANAILPVSQDLTPPSGQQNALVTQLIQTLGAAVPWLFGLLAVCALAALQSTSAAFTSTTSSMVSRDILRRFLAPSASDAAQKFWSRVFVLVLVLVALWLAQSATPTLERLGSLALAYAFQLWPALIGICYWPFLNKPGIVLGLIAGLIAVTLTDSTGATVFSWLGYEAPLWGSAPLTIHAACWGIIVNLGVAIVISAITQLRRGRQHRLQFHYFLRQHADLPEDKKSLVPLAWLIALVWFFFGVGPGAVIGNWLFGDPNDPSTWLFGIPSIWTWQLLFWALGVFMMWFLAYKMELGTVPERDIDERALGVAAT